MSVFDWIEEQEHVFDAISPLERRLAGEFSILWSYFEGKVCNRNAGMKTVQALAQEVGGSNFLDNQVVASTLAYFRRRYLDANGTTYHFDLLRFPKADAARALRILRDENASKEDALEVCMMIICRYRHNLAHGEKWAYHLRGQRQNFTHAIELLKAVIPVTRRVRRMR